MDNPSDDAKSSKVKSEEEDVEEKKKRDKGSLLMLG
jgi:hypothetical protein